jgi:hypothetical protein
LLSSVIISGTCARGCEGNKRLFGTGEIVARRDDGRLVVLTARHVIADMSDPRVYVRNGTPEGTRIDSAVRDAVGRPAGVIAQSAEIDLALVSFRPSPRDAYGVALFSTDASAAGGDVVGGPNGALWTVSPYSALPPRDDATLVTCETCGPGDSGGGVFDRRGALAGILVSQQVFVKKNEPPELGTRSTHFKIVPLGDVRTFVASTPFDEPASVRARDDPWSRFPPPPARRPLPPRDAPTGPWSRFETQAVSPTP